MDFDSKHNISTFNELMQLLDVTFLDKVLYFVFYRVIRTLTNVLGNSKSCAITRLSIRFPKHSSFSETSTRASITPQKMFPIS